jgi:hypothetical protein
MFPQWVRGVGRDCLRPECCTRDIEMHIEKRLRGGSFFKRLVILGPLRGVRANKAGDWQETLRASRNFAIAARPARRAVWRHLAGCAPLRHISSAVAPQH